MENNKIIGVSYARVNGYVQNSGLQSITDQHSGNKETLTKNGCTDIVCFEDIASGISNTEERTGLNNAILYAINNKVACFCVQDVTRLTRSQDDGIAIYQKLIDNNIDLYCGVEKVESKSGDHFMFSMMFSLSRFFNQHMSERIKRSMDMIYTSGRYPRKAPFGYRNTRLKDGSAYITLPENSKFILHLVFKKFIANEVESCRDFALKIYRYALQSRWMKGPKKNLVKFGQSVLTNPFYAGYFLHDGKYIQHIYDSFITLDEHLKILKKINDRRTTPNVPRDILVVDKDGTERRIKMNLI